MARAQSCRRFFPLPARTPAVWTCRMTGAFMTWFITGFMSRGFASFARQLLPLYNHHNPSWAICVRLIDWTLIDISRNRNALIESHTLLGFNFGIGAGRKLFMGTCLYYYDPSVDTDVNCFHWKSGAVEINSPGGWGIHNVRGAVHSGRTPGWFGSVHLIYHFYT